MLWTDEGSRDFIAEHYPWFLDTFNGYRYPIQRADAIRYFVLFHYGGIYFDLDIGCLRPLDPLLIHPIVLPKTIPVGVSNDLMFAAKGHAFLAQTIHNLVTFDHSWILNYPTVMFSTGPMFLSAQYALYTSSHMSDPIRILPKSLYGKNAKEGEAPHSFFSHFYGSSWHADDAPFIGFLGTWGKGMMWFGLILLLVGMFKMMLPGKQRRYSLRRYEVLFPRWSHRTGRVHFHVSRSSDSRPPFQDESMPNSPLDSHVPVLHLPFLSPSSHEQYSRPSTPLLEAFQRVRNRVSRVGAQFEEPPPSTPVRPRRPYSRGVLFYLPAIFTPPTDGDVPLLSRPQGKNPPLPESVFAFA
jgi:inositol phosphorylceramide mannosyltransferase catalytic subunit